MIGSVSCEVSSSEDTRCVSVGVNGDGIFLPSTVEFATTSMIYVSLADTVKTEFANPTKHVKTHLFAAIIRPSAIHYVGWHWNNDHIVVFYFLFDDLFDLEGIFQDLWP